MILLTSIVIEALGNKKIKDELLFERIQLSREARNTNDLTNVLENVSSNLIEALRKGKIFLIKLIFSEYNDHKFTQLIRIENNFEQNCCIATFSIPKFCVVENTQP